MPASGITGYAHAASEVIDALSKLLKFITLTNKTARCKRRDFEEQTEELRDTASEIDSLIAELSILEADKTVTDVKKAKKKVALHKTLATEIRRYVHLYQFKMKNTWDKLQQMQQSENLKYSLQPMPPMEKLTIHTHIGSGIDMKLLKALLTEPVGRFAVFYRWVQNRLHCLTCCGTTLPPPVRSKCLGETIVFDQSPPKTTEDADCPTKIPPVTCPERKNSDSSIVLAVPNQEHPTFVPSDDESDDDEALYVTTGKASSAIPTTNNQTEQKSPRLVPYSDTDESDNED